MSDELKPCPFCGGDASMQRFNASTTPARIICKCGIELRAVKGQSVESIVEQWNTRAAVTDEQFAVAVHNGEAWQKVRECEWRPEHDGENFTTECGAMFFWEPPTPPHCPYCGGRVKVVG
ncbi:Lar family restriction alleviation protein [Adlercreutzia caecimuris]|jgi:Lar family restriction alleviation protein|uniref:Lar family restriction alleviation protein n=1 Tax=Adlercreutzia caecimuris TaxID=671266 RepID=UPI001C3D1FA8|nr:Lar family restriction alleviation protein [Adlercreutzia caecimuris]